MAIRTSRPTVTTTAAQLNTWAESDVTVGEKPKQSCLVHNKGSVSVYVGGPDVTSGNGFEVAADATLSVDMNGTDALWGVTASGSAACDVMQSGV